MYKIGPTQKKILLAIMGGVALGLTHSPRQYYRTLKKIRTEWKNIDQFSFERSIRKLADCRLVEEVVLSNGSIRLRLTEEGKVEARRLSVIGTTIHFNKPKRWDGKWRLVIFDIPERDRKFRDILRNHLHELKFKKLQHSVFVSPWPFEKPILDLVALYSAGSYVRVITADAIDNEVILKRHFFVKNTDAT